MKDWNAFATELIELETVAAFQISPGHPLQPKTILRTVPTFVTVHTFCASRDTRVSYGWCLLIQGYFCAV